MVTPLIIGGAVATLALVVGLSFARRNKMHNQGKAHQSGLVEAKKNTLRSELRDLGLGIKQVQGYIDALKVDVVPPSNIAAIRAEAQGEIDKAQALKSQIETALDKATTDHQVDGFALGLEEARRQVQKARSLALLKQAGDEDEDED